MQMLAKNTVMDSTNDKHNSTPKDPVNYSSVIMLSFVYRKQ